MLPFSTDDTVSRHHGTAWLVVAAHGVFPWKKQKTAHIM